MHMYRIFKFSIKNRVCIPTAIMSWTKAD